MIGGNMARGRLFSVRGIVVIVFLILLAILILQNTEVIQIDIFFWGVSAPRFILFIISFVIGLIIGGVISYAIFLKKKGE